MSENLIGRGLYTPAEASQLLGISVAKISRWLKGHQANGKKYEALWNPEIELDNQLWALGFRDLMEIRVAKAFIDLGISAIQVRKAIVVARDLIKNDHPLATNKFRTDGREIFLQVIETDHEGVVKTSLLNLFKRQYEFNGVIDPILKTVDFNEDGEPLLWWPKGRNGQIVLDPNRSFGQPIDSASSVPTIILANAAKLSGVSEAAKAYYVSSAAVKRAVEFEKSLEHRIAA